MQILNQDFPLARLQMQAAGIEGEGMESAADFTAGLHGNARDVDSVIDQDLRRLRDEGGNIRRVGG